MKLSYFDIGGRAEPIRLAFIATDTSFEDCRFNLSGWMDVKPMTPFGTVPILEKNDDRIGQSQSILRYAGRTTGLYPTTNHWAAARIDDILHFILEDLMGPLNATFKMEEPEKAEKQGALFDGPLLDNLAQLDKAIERNLNDGVCEDLELTIADLLVSTTVSTMTGGILDGLPKNICDPYKNIMNCHQKVTSHPKIMKYYASKDVPE